MYDNMAAQHQPGLLDRVKWILEKRELTQERLGELAGFKSRTQVSSILSRLKRDPEYPRKMALETLERLAKGGRVSRVWLIFGIGTPEQPDTEMPELRLSEPAPAQPPKFPNLETALRYEEFKWPQFAIRAARELELDDDPSPREWSSILDRLQKVLEQEIARVKKS